MTAGRLDWRAPPAAVASAAWLLMAYAVLSLARIWLFGRGPPASPAAVLVWVAALAGIAWVARSMYLGRNWARWLLALAVGLALVLFPLQKPGLPEGVELWLYVPQLLMPIAAAALAFTPRANAWFGARRADRLS